MKERLTTLLLAIGAFALFYAMFIGSSGGPELPATARPTSIEREGNGQYAAAEWLRRSGYEVLSWRETYAGLGNAARGDLLVVTLPVTSGIETTELPALDRWLRAGNTLLVLAPLADAPDWTLGDLPQFDLTALTGLEFDEPPRPQQNADAAPPNVDAPPDADAPAIPAQLRAVVQNAVPRAPHALLDGVSVVRGVSDQARSVWRLRVPYEGFALELARDRDSNAGVVWLRALGQGRIIIGGYASLLSNRMLGEADNARLLANIVGGVVRPGGRVLFDDGHHGLRPDYDPQQFFGDRRLHWTIAIVLAGWLAWVLGGTRLRTPDSALRSPASTDLVRASGEFFARVVAPHAAARRLFELFFERLRISRQASRGEAAPWDWLETHPRVASADVGQLKAWYADARGGRRLPLRDLHNLILRIDGQTS